MKLQKRKFIKRKMVMMMRRRKKIMMKMRKWKKIMKELKMTTKTMEIISKSKLIIIILTN